MESDELLVCIRTRQMVELRACFPTLTERDLMQMVHAPAQRAVYILQHSFGCNLEDAKAAWNDYVLRYVDGQAEAYGPTHQQASLSPALLH
jgi:hypothetical protein